MTDKMHAVVINSYGDESKLEYTDIDIPEINSNQVLVKNKATSINPIDWKLREGYLKQMFDWEFPIVLGWDLAGIITQVGADVKNWHVGDEVFARPATTNRGTYAEYVAVDSELLASKPANISFAEAAAVPLAGETAWQALFTHGMLRPNQSVLIQAGAGGVGTYAIQFAKAIGAKVITTTSPKHLELVNSLGADIVIDYHTEKITDRLSDIDLVFDTLGGKNQLEAFKVLKEGGKQISIVGKADGTDDILKKEKVGFKDIWLDPKGSDLQKIANLMKKGQVKSIIDTTIPFSKEGVVKAHQLNASHHTTGKIILEF